jgi:hypothetical protein
VKEGGLLLKLLPAGSEAHTYTDMAHGYMSRGVTVAGYPHDNSFLAKGTPGEVADAQKDALQRTVRFFTAALGRPRVAPKEVSFPPSTDYPLLLTDFHAVAMLVALLIIYGGWCSTPP